MYGCLFLSFHPYPSSFSKAYVARINEVNPVLHAVIEINPDALTIAASLDAERADGSTRGYCY